MDGMMVGTSALPSRPPAAPEPGPVPAWFLLGCRKAAQRKARMAEWAALDPDDRAYRIAFAAWQAGRAGLGPAVPPPVRSDSRLAQGRAALVAVLAQPGRSWTEDGAELDARAFEAAIWRERPALMRQARGLVRGTPLDAEDLVQDAFMLALRYRRSFIPGTNVGAWLNTIMRNRASTLRGKHRFEVQPFEDVAEAESLPGQSVGPAAFHAVALREALERVAELPGSMRDALMAAAMGENLGDLAKAAGHGSSTLKCRAFRARQVLRQLEGAA